MDCSLITGIVIGVLTGIFQIAVAYINKSSSRKSVDEIRKNYEEILKGKDERIALLDQALSIARHDYERLERTYDPIKQDKIAQIKDRKIQELEEQNIAVKKAISKAYNELVAQAEMIQMIKDKEDILTLKQTAFEYASSSSRTPSPTPKPIAEASSSIARAVDPGKLEEIQKLEAKSDSIFKRWQDLKESSESNQQESNDSKKDK